MNARFLKKLNNTFILRHLDFLLIAFLTFVYFYYFLNKGLIVYDEGYVFEASILTSLGKIPYKDFFFQYTPLTAWIGASWFKLFGVGILKLRFLALLISTGSVITGYTFAKKVFSKKVTILLLLMFVAWGFPQTNFLWPSAVAIFLLLLLIYFLFRLTETNRSLYLVLSGFVVVLSILNKQNLGAASLIGASAYIAFLWIKGKKKIKLLIFIYSIIVAFLLSLFFFRLDTKTLMGLKEFFVRSLSVASGNTIFSVYPLISPLEAGLYGIAKWLGKTFIYVFPLFLYAVSAIFALVKKPKNNIWYILFFLTSLYFLALIWPVADLAHLSFGVPAVALMVAGFSLFRKRLWKTISLILLAVIVLIGFYKTFFMRYYTFETPYLLQSETTTIKGEKFILDKKYNVIGTKLPELGHSLFQNKTVFVHPYMPMFYYLIDKPSPTYELYTVQGLLSEDKQLTIVSELEDKKIDFVVIRRDEEKDSKNLISKYVMENYQKVDSVWDYDILKRK